MPAAGGEITEAAMPSMTPLSAGQPVQKPATAMSAQPAVLPAAPQPPSAVVEAPKTAPLVGPKPITPLPSGTGALKIVSQREKAAERTHAAYVPDKGFTEDYALPPVYGKTYCTLIARDPYCIYAYWEIAPAALAELKKKIGRVFARSVYILRLYDVTLIDFDGTNANRTVDIEVGPQADNWYINMWCDNITCCGEIGLRTPMGKFYPLARSNFVTTPRAGTSGRSDVVWMEVKAHKLSEPYVVSMPLEPRILGRKPSGAGGGQARRGQSGIEGATARASEKRGVAEPVVTAAESTVVERRQRRILSEDDIWAHYNKQTVRASKRDGEVAAAESTVGRSRKYVLSEDDIRAYYRKLFQVIGARRPLKALRYPGRIRRRILGVEQRGISELARGYKDGAAAGGASEAAGQWGGASEGFASGQGANERGKQERKFFFEIGTELIVYGRTEADATVEMNNEIVPLRNDGSFTLRFALPDGAIPLDFKAQSHDRGETISISTAVERKTTTYG